MSSDWYIQKFENSEPLSFSVSEIREAFKEIERKEYSTDDTIWWDLGSGASMTVGKKEEKETESILINRPSYEKNDLQALFTLLKKEGMILFSPEFESPFVGTEESIKHLPKEMTDSLGEPVILTSVEQINEKV